MKSWIGKTFIVIGILHLAAGIVTYKNILSEIAAAGFFKAVKDGMYDREAAFWFHIPGFMMIFFGVLLNSAEKARIRIPAFIGRGLLVMVIICIILMPVSGWWTLLVPVGGLLYKSRSAA